MITIIADRHGYKCPPAGALIAAHTADYVPVRRQIRAALDRSEALTVYVSDPVVLAWFADLHRYPETHVAWQIVDPGEEFARLFGAAPAAPFTPRLIAALRLADLPRPPAGSAVHPLTWILGHRLDPVWQHDEPPPGHDAAVAAWALEQGATLEQGLSELVQAQLERWGAQRPAFKAMHAARLREDSASLLIRWGLQRYSEKWRRAQPWGVLPLLEGEPPTTSVSVALREQQYAIQAYWNRLMAEGAIDAHQIATAVAEMSGLSDAELGALQELLRRHAEALDARLLQAIRGRFARLPSAQRLLGRLSDQIAPPKPCMPEPSWQAAAMLRWATAEYMPYFSWVIRFNQDREHQQACAVRYGDWLYAQYQSMLNEADSPLLLGQYQEVDKLLKRDERCFVVWLIVDGMTWWQGPIMLEACARQGLHPLGQRPGIAVLPSVTSISKRALVSGQPTIDLAQQTIAEVARAKFRRGNIAAVVEYRLARAIEALRQDTNLRAAVILFNLVDVLAHQTTSFTDDAGIRGYMEELAHALKEVHTVCAEQGRRLHILVGSDHGSTLLPNDARSLNLPLATREIDDRFEPELPGQETQKPGTRAAATDLEHLPAIDPEDWYVLDRDRFQLDRHYLVPRGYSYIKRRPTGWAHGGLTPEETIVPLLHLTAELPQVQAVELELRGTLRVGHAGTVTAVLLNLNQFPITDLTLLVSDGPEEVGLHHLGALEQHELELHFSSVSAPGAELVVSYEVRYNALGAQRSESGRISIPLRRLQTEDTSFDDMFN